MKKTKCLFDERKQTPEGMVSVSQLQSFMSCSKKWEYGYIENLTPRIERPYLSIGKLCHKGMQTAMQYAWKEGIDVRDRWFIWRVAGIEAMQEEFDEYMNSVSLLDQEIPEFKKMLDDAIDVFSQAYEEFQPWRYRVLTVVDPSGKEIPALELHFVVPCAGSKGLHGYIDAILEDTVTGFVWCTDYKFRKSLSPDDDEAVNIQNAVYTRACAKMGIDITGTMTWQHLNTPAAAPSVLKNGTVSRAKIKTTWVKYAECVVDAGGDPEDYREEMEEKLSDIEWFRPTYEYRNKETVERMWNQCVVPAARAIQKARNPKTVKYRSLYPWNCKMCQYRSLCQAELRDYDAQYIRSTEYVVRSHARNDNKAIDE